MSLLPEVCNLAQQAADAIMEVYGKADFEVAIKSDQSPVTEADLRASEILVTGLTRISGLPVLSEEALVDYGVRKNWERFWLVDPLDGTKDFIKRDGEFTVNIALIDKDLPILGVVAIPASGVMYTAERGQGAFRVAGGLRTQVSYKPSRTELICADSRFHSAPEIEGFCARNGIQKIERYGSSLKACRLAEGMIDVYPRFGTTMEWDTAASQAIVEEAGCVMLEMSSGRPLTYNKEDLRNPSFIAHPRGMKLS